MPYQLLIRNHTTENLAELFVRGKSLSFDATPFVVDAEVGLPAGSKLSFYEKNGEMLVRNEGSQSVLLGEKILAAGAEVPVFHGNILYLENKELRFYRLHGRPGVSMTANLIGYLALAGIVLSLLVEFGSVFRMPTLLKNSSTVRQQVAIQALTAKVDRIRKRLNSQELSALVKNDAISSAYLEALKEEMEKRVRFLRMNIDLLSETERQEHSENLDRLEAILDRLAANPDVTPKIPDVKIDGPVNHLIEQE